MFKWKLIAGLSETEDEWNKLVDMTLGNPVHSNRRLSFLRAREALSYLLKSIGESPRPLDLKLVNHHRLSQWPYLTVSLSHSQDLGAAIIGSRENYISLGIDIEKLGREVKDAVLQRVSHPHDTTMDSLKLWCLKEACFKALMNSERLEKPCEFSSILVLSSGEWSHSPSHSKGKWELHLKEDHVIAIAFIEA